MTRKIGVPHDPKDPRPSDFTLSEVRGLQEDVPNREAEPRAHFIADWGIRLTDGALVIHLFPPLDASGKISEDWDYSYELNKRLDRAIPQCFDVSNVTAGYESEYSSFFVIVGGGALSLDPRLVVKRFLDAIEAPLH
jgi:hypothetical protein